MAFAKRTETIKFGVFMSGEYKESKRVKQEPKTNVIDVLTGIATTGTIVAVSKAVLPIAAIAIPITLIAGKTALSATSTAIPTGEVVMVGAIPESVKAKIVHAFDPLIDLMIGLSVPIAGVMITGGALMVMIGQKDAGMRLIMNSALGYVLVNLSPLLLDLLVGIGSAV